MQIMIFLLSSVS